MMEQGQYFADFFCGNGGVGKALERRGHRAVWWDEAIDARYDLTDERNLKRIE